MIKKIPINFILFAINPVLFLYYYNIDKIPFSITAASLTVLVLFSIGLFLLIYGLCKDVYKTASIVSFFYFFLFLYGHIVKFLPYVYVNTPFGYLNKHNIIMPVWFLGLVWVTGTVYKVSTKTQRLSYILNVFGGVSFITNTVLI